ncbi:hypothetical protein [Paraflavitalea sp. CAU 1676]|uniref:hypothetical protein n=1 Tax=Paraflavitalea sp. CAU 1676 TaxID=3032598 RepID=UPI0023DAE480|nr:hypothetical protein [Paraflavitalea sp. CAU 1676]MDF2189755.1 hypothetical protein [Paraflavitalea sp. CAU 1676]
MTKFPRQKWLLLLVGILLVTNIITLSFYWSMKPATQNRNNQGEGDRNKRMGQFMVNELKLDKEQETAYWLLRDTLMSKQKTLWDSIRNSKKRFYDLLKDTASGSLIPKYGTTGPMSAQDSFIYNKAEQIGLLQKELDLVTFRHFQQVRALCKPDQVLKFDTVIKEIVNRMTGGWRNPGKQGTPKDSAARK